MKFFKNSHLKNINSEQLATLDDMRIIFQCSSSTYLQLLNYHFEMQCKVQDGIWKQVYQRVQTISKKNGCEERTVHRFHKDCANFILRKKRWKDGKQTSNIYRMNKTFYRFMKAFSKLGLFRPDVNFSERWEWIEKLWEKSVFDVTRFINNVYNSNPISLRKLKEGYKQVDSKMSVSSLDKCQSNSSLTSNLEEICTGWVPSKEIKELETWLKKKIRHACEDMKWFSHQGKEIRTHVGLFSNSLCRHLKPKQ